MRSTENLKSIVIDLVDIASLQAKKMSLKFEAFRPEELIDEVMVGFALPQSRIKNLTIESKVDHYLPEILIGDSNRIKQILYNLISNAIKFTNQGKITLEVKGDQIGEIINFVIQISDTGIGIEEKNLEKIFESFEQNHNQIGSGNSYSGLGLGLTIVRELIVLMNGTISVKSEVNKGSSFTVTVPMQIPDPMINTLESSSFIQKSLKSL